MNAAEAARWLVYARSDLDAARALLNDPDHYPRQVCFLPDVVEDDAHKALQMAEAVYQNVANDLHRYKEG
jgi:hypothetical protein